MMTRDHHQRRRSLESSRRRRRERRDSREYEYQMNQLQHMPEPDPGHQLQPQHQHQQQYQQQYQPQHDYQVAVRQDEYPRDPYGHMQPDVRSRALSSSGFSSSSSTSSSLLNISRDNKKFGLKSFFSSERYQRRVRKKRSRRLFRFGNGSSSSVSSDMAYGKGYIDRRRSRDFTPPKPGRRRDGSDLERPQGPKREKTDEEIIELGRKFAEIARLQNKEDLRRAGRHRPSALVGAAAALSQFNKTSNAGPSERGIGSSRPSRHHSSDDSEWESASEDEYSSEEDSGLVYGSTTHLPAGGNQPIHISSPPPSMSRPGEYERLLQHKPSIVDPKLFGPVNSLRGIVNTPCGFDKLDRRTVSESYGQSSVAGPSASIPASGSVSYEGRPMQSVYPVPTSDPNVFKVGQDSIIVEQDTSRTRPEPVPIQQPKPIAPVSSKVFDTAESDPRYSRRTSSGTALAGAAAAGLAGAALAGALADRRDGRKDEKEKHREEKRERERERDKDREREERRRSKYADSKYGDERDEKRRSKRSDDKYADGKEEKRKSRDDLDRYEKRREKDKGKEVVRRDPNADREDEREKRRRDKYRDEYDYEREHRDRPKEDHKSDKKETRKDDPREEKHSSRSSEADVYRRLEGPANPSSKGPIDPFQFQVASDAFATPQYGNTPKRPLTPQVFTVDREPDFSRFEDDINPERMSRRDSYERELRDTQDIYESTKNATAPIAAGAIAAATAAIVTEERRGRSRSRGGDRTSRRREDNRDPVQEVANILYRRDLLARQAEEERSRSRSPDRSVVDKWQEDTEPKTPEIVAPPAKEKPKEKSLYDAPDADVRIDNILSPRDLPIMTRGRLLKSRDPSAERERPMLNLVRPTPVPTPVPEKQKAKEETREEPTTGTKRQFKKKKMPQVETTQSVDDVVIGPRGEVVQTPSTPTSKGVTWGENETRRYVVESPERGNVESSGARVVIPAETPKKSGKKSGWGVLAAAIAGSGAGAAAASTVSDSSKSKDKDETSSNVSSSSKKSRESSKDKDETGSNVSSSSRRSRDSPKDIDDNASHVSTSSRKSRDSPKGMRKSSVPWDEIIDEPPVPGPKPPSPRGAQMPGSFAEDMAFTATVAAGLQDSGFDPNIVINNAQYHRRDSPPNSSQPSLYQTPFAETVSDLGVRPVAGSSLSKNGSDHGFILGEVPDTPADEREIATDKSDIYSQLSKKERKKLEKAAKRDSVDNYKSEIVVIEDPEASQPAPLEEDEWATSSKLSKKEQKKRDKAAKAKGIQEEEFGVSTPRDSEPETPQPIVDDDEWSTSTKLSKKEQKKRDKAAKAKALQEEEVIEIASPKEPEPVPVEAAPADEWEDSSSKKKKSKKDKKKEKAIIVQEDPSPFGEADNSKVSVPVDAFRDLQEEVQSTQPDDEWGLPKKSKKKSKRDSEIYDPLSQSGILPEVEVSRDASETKEIQPEDDWDVPKKSKKKSKRDSGLYDSPSQSVAPSEVFGESSRQSEDAITVIPDDGWDTPKKSKKKHSKQDSFATDNTDWTNVPSVVSEPMTKSQSTDYFSTVEPTSYDDWDVSKKSKKKSKRDSTSYDSPAQTPTTADNIVESPKAMTESFSDLRSEKNGDLVDDEWDLPKKSKKKSKRDSGVYDSPSGSRSASRSAAPSEISTSESSKKKSKRDSYADSPSRSKDDSEISERKSKKEKRRSAPGSFPEDDDGEPPDRGRDIYQFLDNDVSSVVSAPIRDDDHRRSDKNRSRSRFDDFDDAKSVASAPGGTRKSSSKSEKDKEKRNSGSSGLFDRFKSSIGISDEKDKGSRKSEEDKKQSFLDNAGTLGAGVGLAGAAALVGAQMSRPNATDVPSEKEAHSIPFTPQPRSSPSAQRRGSDIIDPEIVQREIRPAIDPQYGDLLPLPPSPPPGSLTSETDELPALPDSRPETPEHERQLLRELRNKPSHIRRKSANETPLNLRSPSQSAIPLRFGIGKGKRSEPSSPGFRRSSPMSSPIAAPAENYSASKTRSPRPISWDNTKEFKPLYLVEKTSRDSIALTPDFEENLPQLPESGPPSRESPAPEAKEREEDVQYEHARDLSTDLALKLDIPTALADFEAKGLGSPDTTPKAQTAALTDAFSTPHQREFAADEPDLPPTLDNQDQGTPKPEPVEPMSKDRSSYLLHSSPPSVKKETNVSDLHQDSPSRIALSKSGELTDIPESTDDHNKQELAGLGVMAGVAAGTAAAIALLDEPDVQQPDDMSTDHDVFVDASDNLPGQDEPAEFSLSSKKSKKSKKGKKGKSVEIDELPPSQATDDAPQPDTDASLSQDLATSAPEPPVIEDDFAPITPSKKGKKGKKNKKSLAWEPEAEPLPEVEGTAQPVQDISEIPEDSTPLITDEVTTPTPEISQQETGSEQPTLQRSTSISSKKGKKKKGKLVAWEPEPEPELGAISSTPETTDIANDAIAEDSSQPLDITSEAFPETPSEPIQLTTREPAITEEPEPVLAGKKGKKKKGKKSQIWDPEPDFTSSQDTAPTSSFNFEESQEISSDPSPPSNTQVAELSSAPAEQSLDFPEATSASDEQQRSTTETAPAESQSTGATSDAQNSAAETVSFEDTDAVREPDVPAPFSAEMQVEGRHTDIADLSNVKQVDTDLPKYVVEASMQPDPASSASGEGQSQLNPGLGAPLEDPLAGVGSEDNTIDRLAQPPVEMENVVPASDSHGEGAIVPEPNTKEIIDDWQQDFGSSKKKSKKDKKKRQSASVSLETEPDAPTTSLETPQEPLPQNVHLTEQSTESLTSTGDEPVPTQPEMEATADDIWATPVKSGKKGKKGKKGRQASQVIKLDNDVENSQQGPEETPSTDTTDVTLSAPVSTEPVSSGSWADEVEAEESKDVDITESLQPETQPAPEPEPELSVSKKKSKKDKKKNRASPQFDQTLDEASPEPLETPAVVDEPLSTEPLSVDQGLNPDGERAIDQPDTEKELADDPWAATSSKKSKKKKRQSVLWEDTPAASDTQPESQTEPNLPIDEPPMLDDDVDTGVASSKKSKKDKKKRKVLFMGTSDENLLKAAAESENGPTNTRQSEEPALSGTEPTIDAPMADGTPAPDTAEDAAPAHDSLLRNEDQKVPQSSQDQTATPDTEMGQSQDLSKPESYSEPANVPESHEEQDANAQATEVTGALPTMEQDPVLEVPSGENAPGVTPEDEFPVFTKKSKKDKKKRKSKIDDMLESTSGTSTPKEESTVDATTVEFPTDTPSASQDQVQPEQIISETPTGEDSTPIDADDQKTDDADFTGFSTKKSKKDKKKKKRGSQIQDSEPEPEAEKTSLGEQEQEQLARSQSPVVAADTSEALASAKQDVPEESKELPLDASVLNQSQSPTPGEAAQAVTEATDSEQLPSEEPLAHRPESPSRVVDAAEHVVPEPVAAAGELESMMPSEQPAEPQEDDFAPITSKKDKKKKKRRSQVEEPELTKKSSFEEMMNDWPADESQQKPAQEEGPAAPLEQPTGEPQDDDFSGFSSAKKSKKDKKKKRASRVPSDECPTTPSEEDVGQSTSSVPEPKSISAPELPEDAPVLQDTVIEPQEGSEQKAVPVAELPEQATVYETLNNAVLTDVKDNTDDSLAREEPSAEVEQQISAEAPKSPILGQTTEQDVPKPEEDPVEFFTAPKSKKDKKKKKKRDSQVVTEDPVSLPEESSTSTPEDPVSGLDVDHVQLQDTSSRQVDASPDETAVSGPAPEVAEPSVEPDPSPSTAVEIPVEDDFTGFASAKKSKKDKKKKKQASAWDDENQPDQSQTVEDPAKSNVEAVEEQPAADDSTPLDSAKEEEGFDVTPAKKSKKDKKKKKSASVWEFDEPQEQPTPPEAPQEPATQEMEQAQSVEETPLDSSKDDDFSGFAFSKKSKKDKKKKKASIWEPEPETEPSAVPQVTEESPTEPLVTEKTAKPEHEVLASEAAVLGQSEEASAKIRGVEEPIPGSETVAPEPTTTDRIIESQENVAEDVAPVVVEDPTNDQLVTEEGVIPTPQTQNQDVSQDEPEFFVTKKSKKDKKKKRASQIQDWEPETSTSTPVQEEPQSQLEVEPSPVQEDASLPQDEPTVQESIPSQPAETPDDIFPEFTVGKKSKKDKKKKKGSQAFDWEPEPEPEIATPIEEPPKVEEPRHLEEPQTVEETRTAEELPKSPVLEQPLENEMPVVPEEHLSASKEAEDPQESFSGFVSKKDKKKKKKGLQAQADWEEPAIATAQDEAQPLQDNSLVSEQQIEEVAPSQDELPVSRDAQPADELPEFVSTKKSKKDKKKKKGQAQFDWEEPSAPTPVEDPLSAQQSMQDPALEPAQDTVTIEQPASGEAGSTDAANLTTAEPADEFPEFVSSKKSKKDKKKAKKAAILSTEPEPELPGEDKITAVKDDTMSPQPLPEASAGEDLPPNNDELASAAAEPSVDPEMQVVPATEHVASTSAPTGIVEHSDAQPDLESEPVMQLQEQSTVDAISNDALAAESSGLHQEGDQVQSRESPENVPDEGIPEPPTVIPQDDTGDFSEFAVNKSKKDKKKGKKAKALENLTWGNDQPVPDQVEQVVSEDASTHAESAHDPATTVPITEEAPLQPELASEQPAEPESSIPRDTGEDLFPLTRKKSKKDKKKQKAVALLDSDPPSGTQTPQPEVPQDDSMGPTSLPSEIREIANPELSQDISVAEPLELEIGGKTVVEQLESSEPVVEDWPEYATKKSKKDKKKRKSIAQVESEPASGAQTPTINENQLGDEINPEATTVEAKEPPITETMTTEEPAITEHTITEEPVAPAPVDDEWASFSNKKSKKDKKKRKSLGFAESEPASGTQTPAVEQTDLDLSLPESAAAAAAPISDPSEPLQATEPEPAPEPSAPVEDEWPSYATKKSKKDKKGKKKGKTSGTTTPLESQPPIGTELDSTKAKDVWDDDSFFQPKDQTPGDATPEETQPFDPQETSPGIDLSPAQTTSNLDHEAPFDHTTQRGKKVRMHSHLDDTIIPEPISASREYAASYLEDPSHSVTKHRDSSSMPEVPMDDTSRYGYEAAIPSSPYPSYHEAGYENEASSRQEKDSEDILPPITPAREMAAAYFESQPKLLEEIPQDDQSWGFKSNQTSLPPITPRREIAASYFDPQPELLGGASKRETSPELLPVVSQSSVKAGKESQAARDMAADFMESRSGKTRNSGESSSLKMESERQDDPSTAEALAAAGALTGGVALLADKFGGSKKTKGKGKKKSKYVDKRTPKEDDFFDDPSLWESSERKTVADGGRLDADTGDFWDVPADAEGEAEGASQTIMDAEAAEQRARGIPENLMASNWDSAESPVTGREETRSFAEHQPTKQEAQPSEYQSTDLMRTLDDMDTSEPVGERSISGHDYDFQRTLPSSRDMDWARTSTMSVRSLPPVEEEPNEELEATLSKKPQPREVMRTPDINRDSGFIANSPQSARRSLTEDIGNRDSGVHMRDWPEHAPPKREGLSSFDETGARLSWASEDSRSGSARDIRTPKTGEKKHQKSALGNETPRLSTPSRLGRDTSPDPEKKDESHATRTKTPRSAKYQTLGTDASPALTPHAFGQRSVSDSLSREGSPRAEAENHRRTASNTSLSRLRTPEPLNLRPDSPGSIRSSGTNTPPLRRVDKRVSGDLRSLSQHNGSHSSLHSTTTRDTKDKDLAAAAAAAAHHAERRAQSSTTPPVANEGRVRAKDMTDVYDGLGEGRIGSPRSPTRPHSMRRRQSMQVLELESRVEQLIAENRMLADAKLHAESGVNQRAAVTLNERDALIEQLRSSLDEYKREIDRLKEVNEGLHSANAQLAQQHNEQYSHLEVQHATAASELEGVRGTFTRSLQEKDAEIEQLRQELEATKQQVREMQRQILASKPPDADFLRLRDEDHFDNRCQQLCAHVQQWVLRFSKFSDMRAARLTNEINDEKIIDRLDNTVLDGSDVDDYLSDRVRRRDIFMSMTMNMIWEYVFTRYLFGMDREQRQKLKALEKLLSDVGPPHAVRQWRAVTLTLLSRRPAFGNQRNDDTEAVVQAILETLSKILPPPSNMENQIQSQLRRVLREAVDLSIEMRTQRAEFMMLPPLQPEYDANGDLADTVTFNASLMNERSGSSTSNEELEAQGAVVRTVLFPLVVKKGDDNGVGDEEIVVCPAQVLVAKPSHRSIRMVTPSSEFGGAPISRGATPSVISKSVVSLPMSPGSQAEAEYMEGGI
ncbi:uncharacterized protein JN550_009380 [Neoarthrinium moseri]|uniref:uncharacterized protein n=1 Tax=Neoarthrinium moseri TaxID=1658444 RepID=UPI001FDC8A69|nr:uncharacterized protein JN550_009380 [Neoarthrinium moseri]KAI1863882.1 hypothetical protein JN550_009380 [Neoarthrinium moseri]